jgi:uncharacterized protein (DUF1810 family)
VLLEGRSAADVFGYPDTFKLKSSMTLFASVTDDPDSVFARVLDKYYQGERDSKTLQILERLGEEG